MNFDEFVEQLYKIGWRAILDAQHTKIRELWNDLLERGLVGDCGQVMLGDVHCTCPKSPLGFVMVQAHDCPEHGTASN